MIVVFLALLMFFGVLFGPGAFVVDLGYGMAQQGAIQNAADAGALAAGKLMAGSVSLDTSGRPVYGLTDNQLHNTVASIAPVNFMGTWVTMGRNPTSADKPPTYSVGTMWFNTVTGAEFELTQKDPRPATPVWLPAEATHQIAVQYLDCSGNSSGTPKFTARSNRDLVIDISGSDTRQKSAQADALGVGGASWSSTQSICMLRVWTRESHQKLFAAALFRATDTPEQELAQATVRIAPSSPPTTFSDVWPITHYDDPNNPDPACAFELNGCALPFWDSHGIGNFKLLIDMSRYSALGGGGTREQLFAPDLGPAPITPPPPLPLKDQVCTSAALESLFHLQPCYDPTWPGTHSKQTDLGHWLANGWNGQIYLPNESDPKCTSSTRVVQECPNSRLEVFGGDLGSNISVPMNQYIANHPDSPGCNCASVNVFFFRYGEQNVNASTNIGTVWNGGNGLQRVIIDKVRRFRFNTSTVQSSSVSGYFVGFYTDNPPQDGPPNNIANTVTLVG
jgi:hypothetical protein